MGCCASALCAWGMEPLFWAPSTKESHLSDYLVPGVSLTVVPHNIGVASVGINAVVEENTPQNAVMYDLDCDCEYFPGGCKIVEAAPKKTACKCRYMGGWTCRGDVVACSNPFSPKCVDPDTSAEACLLGGGDCGGYNCDCDYHSGGCQISKAAPDYSACKCDLKGFWTCGGDVVGCTNPSAPLCANPDKSERSCWLGGGDCDGY